MHPRKRFYIVGLLFLSVMSVHGQNFEYPWAVSAGANLVNYRPHPGNPALHENLFNFGYQVGVQKYLNRAFDFRAQLLVAPSVSFPEGIISRTNSPLIDMQYRLSFKLNNGIIMRENGRIGPYLSIGMGGSYVRNHPDAYVPLGGGLRVRINQRMAIRLESTRKISANKDYQNVDHALAFIYNMDTKKNKVQLDPQEIKDIETVATLIPPDTDHDGLIDSQDECPEVAGPLGMNGCPTKDFSEMDAEVVVIDETATVKDNELTPVNPAKTEQDSPSKLENQLTLVPETKTKEVPPTVVDLEDKTEPESKEEVVVATTQPKEEKIEAKPVKTDNVVKTTPCGKEIDAKKVSTTINFAFGSDRIPPGAVKQLDKIAEQMKSCSETKLVLSGHTDDKGTERDNLVLSIKRAFNVKYYLVHTHNISQYRITSDGLGEEKPLAENSSSNGRERNRRVDMKFVF